jgi:hypothetical protein
MAQKVVVVHDCEGNAGSGGSDGSYSRCDSHHVIHNPNAQSLGALGVFPEWHKYEPNRIQTQSRKICK